MNPVKGDTQKDLEHKTQLPLCDWKAHPSPLCGNESAEQRAVLYQANMDQNQPNSQENMLCISFDQPRGFLTTTGSQ